MSNFEKMARTIKELATPAICHQGWIWTDWTYLGPKFSAHFVIFIVTCFKNIVLVVVFFVYIFKMFNSWIILNLYLY